MKRSYRCLYNVAITMQPQDPNTNTFSRFYTRIFGVATALLLATACYRLLLPFAGSVLWALLFTLALNPIHVRMTRWLHGRQQLSAILMTTFTLLAIVGPLTAIGVAFVHQTSQLLQYLQDWLNTEGHDPMSLVNQPALRTVINWLSDNLGITTVEIRRWLDEATHASVGVLASTSGKLFLGAIGTVVGLLLTLFLMFFFIRDGIVMLNAIRDLVPLPAPRRQALFSHLAAVTRAVMFGVGLTALVQGTLVGIALAIVGSPSPLVLGVMAALFALLPIGGTALIWVPAVFVLFVQDRWGAAIFMVVWGIMVTLSDNFLRPMLISGRASVATLTVFLGVLGGVTAFGAVGLFVGPVILALVIALIEFALETQRQLPRLIISTVNDKQNTPSDPT